MLERQDFLKLGFVACLLILILVLKYFQPVETEIDLQPELAVTSHIFYPTQLPDGHYTVTAALPYGETVIIHHLPGPDRNFVYFVVNRFVSNIPDECQANDQFTVFQGKVI